MPEKDTIFSQAENSRYNVSNVLRDPTAKVKKTDPDAPQEEINLEEGAPFLDRIDPDATIGDYMRLNEEENALADEAPAAETDPEAEETPQTQPEKNEDQPKEGLQNPVIREQAEKARTSFIDDMKSIEEEPGLSKKEKIATQEDDILAPEQELPNDDGEERYDDRDLHSETPPATSEIDEDEEIEELTLKDLLKPAARRIKKPRFVKKTESENEGDGMVSTEEDENENSTPQIEEGNAQQPSSDEIIMSRPISPDETNDVESYEDELEEARAAQKHGHSICTNLYQLQTLLEEGRSPFLHKTEVLVPREKTLRLIHSLTAICEVDPSYIDGASEDKLIDRLVSEGNDEDYMPLERARSRAQAIIQNATQQADTILNDAKTLARQLLAETEAEIKTKYDEADEQIAVRMTTTKEESTKNLNAARSELTASRQRSVEILSKYLEKAESDYQGYWERAEHTVMASLEQSESILGKAAEIYRKELGAIHQDKEELEEILDHMRKYNKRKPEKK